MPTTTENQTAKPKQVPDSYIFENGANGEKGGKPAGADFVHKKGRGFTILIGGKRYAAIPLRRRRLHSRNCWSNPHRERARKRPPLSLSPSRGKRHEPPA